MKVDLPDERNVGVCNEKPEAAIPSNFKLETEPFCDGCGMGMFKLIENTIYFGEYPSTSYMAVCAHMRICKFLKDKENLNNGVQ